MRGIPRTSGAFAALQPRQPRFCAVLLHLGAAALNEDDQHDDKHHAGDNPDNRSSVHDSSFSLSTTFFMCSLVSAVDWSGHHKSVASQSPRRASEPVSETDKAGKPAESYMHPHYLTRERRRWIRITSTMTNSTPATIRMISVVSISDSSFPHWLSVLNESMIMMNAGPKTTRKSDGKINKASGKISLIVVFAAASSTACTR